MDNNTLIAVVFTVGTIVVVILRFIINKSMYNYKGDQNTRAEVFDSNNGLLTNSILTFLMFLAILFYDGCTKDLETSYREEYKIKYENFDKYLENERLKGKEEALDQIRKSLNTTTSN